MKEIEINDARANLFLLIDKAVCGEPFLITQSGRALVKVEAVPQEFPEQFPRLGFMAGQFTIPDDFDALDPQIEKLFYCEK
ncbi:type II toxin-antitoxin system prevent-host-death family antitoxin [Rugamonas sp. FT82W]|uniref:Type II toxin-antitoxin system prevent-host-death family antitoxin n=1 Tax=Duganella vulcania TaxID=2692166 RepID=A0A845G0J4_9BURK|nr:type II toxin-antitoxin system prevent-host-death family antitoxin [Duganella vulcania]MYM86547.1 type II toxin-antitoxin system prevent-host-death family antitoxin [Duganella vulcania]